jgi:hypothetical protein
MLPSAEEEEEDDEGEVDAVDEGEHGARGRRRWRRSGVRSLAALGGIFLFFCAEESPRGARRRRSAELNLSRRLRSPQGRQRMPPQVRRAD